MKGYKIHRIVPTSVNSLNSAASASPSSPAVALTTGLISFLRPFTRFLGFAVAGASLSIKTVDRQSRNVSKLDSSSEEIISQNSAHKQAIVVFFIFRKQIPKEARSHVRVPGRALRSRCIKLNALILRPRRAHDQSLGKSGDLVQARSIMASRDTCDVTHAHASIIITYHKRQWRHARR